MKHALLACLVLVSTPVFAEEPADSYVACLIGRGVIALEAQGAVKDADAAFRDAVSKCPQPDGLDPEVEYGEMAEGWVVAIAEGVR